MNIHKWVLAIRRPLNLMSKKDSLHLHFYFVYMKKLLLIVVVMLLAMLVSVAQENINPNGYNVFYYPNGQKSSEGMLKDGQPEGWWKSYNEQGVLVSEGNRKNHLLDSVWTFYNDQGDKMLVINYNAGKKEGDRIQYFKQEYVVEHWHADTIVRSVNTYHTDGWLKKMTPYEAGVPHGMEKEMNDTGLVIAVANYYRGVLTRRERINRTDNFGYKQGNWKYFWPNGNLKMEVTYLNDKINGFLKRYDENGNFLSVEKYTQGELVADAKETKQLDKKVAYHSNGQPSIIATYYKGVPEGVRREFDENGNVIKSYSYEDGWMRYEGVLDLNGKRQGLWKEYYKSGELRSQGKYVNSNPVGQWKFYFTDKTIEIIGSYDQKGRKTGEWLWFYANGDTMMVANYDAGELDGEFVEYDEEGRVVSKGNYVEGTEEGVWVYYNGGYSEKGSYYDGMRTGEWVTRYPDGKSAFVIHYEQDVMHGKYTSYWENGRVKLTGHYVGGLRDGAWFRYDEEGNLLLTTLYKDGKEIKWNTYEIKD